jgi:hypothetical protein
MRKDSSNMIYQEYEEIVDYMTRDYKNHVQVCMKYWTKYSRYRTGKRALPNTKDLGSCRICSLDHRKNELKTNNRQIIRKSPNVWK